ncbi:MAG TPA: hypothetical protein VIT67_09245 [Povalibacter sp.]|jgi:hypothetical protein
MLKDYIKQGVRIEGLFDLLNSERDAFDGSWTFEMHEIQGRILKFFADGSGTHPVRVLPYKRGENASTPMAGDEVISGEFSGSIMGVYKDRGIAMVTHVDGEQDEDGGAPQKAAWEHRKRESGFELFNESSTQGLIPRLVAGLTDKRLMQRGTGIVIVCVASPTKYYSITRAAMFRDRDRNYKVLKIL